MKNILQKILPRPRRLALANNFNKVSMAGNVAVTGYAIGGLRTAITLTGLTLIYHGAQKLGLAGIMKKLKGQGPKGVDVSDGDLAERILELKDKAGLEGELYLTVTPDPTNQMGTTQLPDGSIVLGISSGLLDRFLTDDVLAISAHEFGHIKHGDVSARKILDSSKRYSAILMYGFGGINSLFSLNPLPLLSAVAGTKIHKILVGVDHRISEYRADDFGARLFGAKKAFDALKRGHMHNLKALPNQAIARHVERLRFLPQILRRQITERKVPGVLIEADMALKRIFDMSHPSTHKRLKALEGIAQEQGEEVDWSDLRESQTVEACVGCLNLESEARKSNITRYARELFRRDFGHDRLVMAFSDCGRKRQQEERMIDIEIAPGVILQVATQGSGEHLPSEEEMAAITQHIMGDIEKMLPPEMIDAMRRDGVLPPPSNDQPS